MHQKLQIARCRFGSKSYLTWLDYLESAFEFENEMVLRRFVTRELEKIWDFYEGVYSFVFYLRI